MNYPLDYGSGSFCWLYLTGYSCLLFQEFSCVFPQKSLSADAPHAEQILGFKQEALQGGQMDSPTPQGLCAGVIALVRLVTALGKDRLTSLFFFSSAVFAPHYVPLLQIYVSCS